MVYHVVRKMRDTARSAGMCSHTPSMVGIPASSACFCGLLLVGFLMRSSPEAFLDAAANFVGVTNQAQGELQARVTVVQV